MNKDSTFQACPDGLLFVVSAPSGAGKTSLCKELIRRYPNLRPSISYTTRKQRNGEVDGSDYHFVSPETFRSMVDEDQLAEWAEVHDNFYGTALSTLEKASAAGTHLLLDIDCQGAAQLKKSYPGAVFVFILPPSLKELEKRLRGRQTDAEEVIARRLSNAAQEIAEAKKYDYLVINDDFDTALEQLCAIIEAEQCRMGRVRPCLEQI
ncbi:MAG: guanylate kinase [Desulfuromonas sp.]|nr:MAG: guanylate kinase [Desulfuromonas sp.]